MTLPEVVFYLLWNLSLSLIVSMSAVQPFVMLLQSMKQSIQTLLFVYFLICERG